MSAIIGLLVLAPREMMTMKKPALGIRVSVTTTIIAVAAGAIGLPCWRYLRNSWTRAGQVHPNSILVTPRVMGVVTGVAVVDSQPVKEGDLLRRIDPSVKLVEVPEHVRLVSGKTASVATRPER